MLSESKKNGEIEVKNEIEEANDSKITKDIDIENEDIGMEQFMEQIDKSMDRIYVGDILKGKIISVNEDEVLVDISYIMDGIIIKEEFSEDGILNPMDIVSVGDEINVYVLKLDDGEGNIVLSRKRAERIVVWDDLEKIYKNEDQILVIIEKLVKGGAIAHYKGVRVFIPASHISLGYVEDLSEYIDVEMKVKIIEFDKEDKRVVASRKVVEKEEFEKNKNKVYSEIKIGDKRNGVVRRMEKYGSFIDIGGVDGLLHISEMSFKRILHPSEVMNVGDKLEVIIQDIDKENDRISLKLSNQFENPWDSIFSKFNIGDIVTGKVVRLKPFGAFVDIGDGLEGLLHISEISEERINKVSDVLKINQEIEVLILDIKEKEKRISLSMKGIDEEEEFNYDEYIDEEDEFSSTLGDLFKDKFDKLK